MKKIILIILLLPHVAFSQIDNTQELTIYDVYTAYNSFNLEQSKSILITLLENDTLNKEMKCKVLREIALQEWKHFKNYELARNHLMIADSIGDSKFKTWELFYRIEKESMNYQNALSVALTAESFSLSESETIIAKQKYAEAVYNLSINNIRNNAKLDSSILINASNILVKILESDVGSPEPSKLLLGISLILNDGANVINAWESYFQVQDINNIYPYLNSSANNLYEVCSRWQGKKVTIKDQESLILALSSSRFYEFINDFTLYNSNQEDYSMSVQDIITYAKYLRLVKTETNEFYRLVSIKKSNKRRYKKWLNETQKELWNNLSFLSDKNFSKQKFINETKKHFGARGFAGGSSAYNGYNLHLGHIVNQEKKLIKQYGYQAKFTYTQIDMLTSNGYSGWFWEGAATAGWATSNEIIRIREVFLDGPLIAWKMLTDSVKRKENEKLIDEFLAFDITDDMHRQSEGLQTKLLFDALNDLYKRLEAKGLKENKLKLAFIAEYEKYITESSIFAHEGRHSIEKKHMPASIFWSSKKKELHAKLSEIVFSAEPRLALYGMVNFSVNSGHGSANREIVNIAIHWIKNNHEQVVGFTEDKSPFSQLYLLTTEQIKECYRAADPLYISYQNKQRGN